MSTDLRQGRRLVRFRSTLASFLAIALVVVANFLSVRLYFHGTFTRRLQPIGDRTENLLNKIEGDIEIVNFVESSNPVYEPLVNTLREFSESAKNLPNLRLEVINIDPSRRAAEAAEITHRHGAPPNSLVIRTRTGSSDWVIPAADLIDTQYNRTRAPASDTNRVAEARIDTNLVAEARIASGLWNVSRSSRPVVYFLTGSGEYDPDNTDLHSGYSAVAHALSLDLYDVRTLDLAAEPAIPLTDSVLVIAGPRVQLPVASIEKIHNYLSAGGRLLLLRGDGPDRGLRELLGRWGVAMQRREGTPSKSAIRTDPASASPIVRAIQGSIPTFGPRLGCIAPAEGFGSGDLPAAADRPRTEILLYAADPSSETNELAAAIAVERGRQSPGGGGPAPTRIVVVGDAEFASNAMTTSGFEYNRTFFLACIHWLSERETFTGNPRNSFRILRSGIRPNQWPEVILVVVAAWPAAILLVGWLFFRRRH